MGTKLRSTKPWPGPVNPIPRPAAHTSLCSPGWTAANRPNMSECCRSRRCSFGHQLCSSIKSLVLLQTIIQLYERSRYAIFAADSLTEMAGWCSISDDAERFGLCGQTVRPATSLRPCAGFLWQLTVMHLIHYKQPLAKLALPVNMPFGYKAIPRVVTPVSHKAAAVMRGGKKRAGILCACSRSEVVQAGAIILTKSFTRVTFGCWLVLHLPNLLSSPLLFFSLLPNASKQLKSSFSDTLHGGNREDKA